MPRKTRAQRGVVATPVVASPLERQAVALLKLAKARRSYELAQRAVAQAVGEARDAGASWADVGDVLRMTRQGARQRFDGNRSEAEGGSLEAAPDPAGSRR